CSYLLEINNDSIHYFFYCLSLVVLKQDSRFYSIGMFDSSKISKCTICSTYSILMS
ncbi:unnamed protein product, partial [Rotaria magnacalcarata]